MRVSTDYPSTSQATTVDLRTDALPADVTLVDAFYGEEYVTIVQPADINLLWPMRLTVERDGDAFIVSDDLTGVYGEGETRAAAMTAYRAALGALRRVLAARQPDLTPELAQRLAVLQSLVPPGE